MRFNVSKTDLQTELSHLVRVTEKKNTIPILTNVLIETGEDSIRLVATDLDVGLVTTCTAEVSEPGAVVLSAKKLFEIVRSLSDAEISFRRETKKRDTGFTTITCAGAEFKMSTQEKEHFPDTAKPPESTTGFSASVLQDLVEHTV